jgi:hypothetical protein
MIKLTIRRDDLIQALTFRFEMMDGGSYLDTATNNLRVSERQEGRCRAESNAERQPVWK